MTELETIIKTISEVGKIGMCDVEVTDRTPVHIVRRIDSAVPKMIYDERRLEYTITIQVFPYAKES